MKKKKIDFLELKLKILFHLKGLPIYILVLFCIIPCVYFTGKYIEAFFEIISLICLRYKFGKTYHCDKTSKCISLTLTIAYVAIPQILPLRLSLFSSIIIGFFVAYISWFVQEFIDNKKKISNLDKKEIKCNKIDLRNCTIEELNKRCNNLNFTKENKEISKMFFIDKCSIWDVAKYLNIEYDSAKKRKLRLKKKLNE